MHSDTIADSDWKSRLWTLLWSGDKNFCQLQSQAVGGPGLLSALVPATPADLASICSSSVSTQSVSSEVRSWRVRGREHLTARQQMTDYLGSLKIWCWEKICHCLYLTFRHTLQSNFYPEILKTYSNDIVSVEDATSITAISVFSNCTLHLQNKIKKLPENTPASNSKTFFCCSTFTFCYTVLLRVSDSTLRNKWELAINCSTKFSGWVFLMRQ